MCRGSSIHQQHLNLASREESRQGGEGLSRVSMPSKISPDDVVSKRDEDRDEDDYITATRRAEGKVIEDRLIWFDCWCRNRRIPSYI